MSDLTKQWENDCSKFLKNKIIKDVRYMTKTEAKEIGWFNRPLVIWFTDGSHMFASSDDEGNDGGAIFTSDKKLPVIPVLKD